MKHRFRIAIAWLILGPAGAVLAQNPGQTPGAPAAQAPAAAQPAATASPAASTAAEPRVSTSPVAKPAVKPAAGDGKRFRTVDKMQLCAGRRSVAIGIATRAKMRPKRFICT